jgi:hypothetical protein
VSRVELARTLGYVAADLDARGYHAAGAVRRAARALLEVDPATDGGCPGCGVEVPYQGRGRPRRWCSERCRRRHRP